MGGGDGAAELPVPGQPRPGSLASLGSGRPGLCPAPPRRRRPGRQRRPRGPAAQRRAAWRRRAGDQPAARPGRGQRTCLQPLLAVQPAVLQCPARRAGDHSRRGGGGTGDPSRRPGRGDGPPGEPGADRLDSGGGPAHAPAAPTPPRLHRARQSLAPRPRRIPPRSRRGPAAPLPLRDPAGAPGRRPRLETLAGAAAPPRRAGGGRVLRRTRRGSGLPCLRPVADPTLPATCPAPGARGRNGHRSGRRPGGGRRWRRQPGLVAAGRAARRSECRRAAGHPQPVRTGLGRFRVQSRRPAPPRLPGIPRDAAGQPGLARRATHRPCDGPATSLADPARPAAPRRRLPALPATRAAAPAGAGGQSRLGAGHRRGPRHRARRPARGTGTPPSAGYPRAALRAARRTLRAPGAMAGGRHGHHQHPRPAEPVRLVAGPGHPLARPRRTPQRRGMRGRPGTARRGAPGPGRQP
ncbi:hypothetical protein PAERUG_P35_London_26_VIM_2_05_12_00581 [Pseudomonas aeruginosa]|nr:hypothetical protein PAERUG_P35_London_26_VIM_2_05_12_00581 [Pseudomonas aeruginosa]CRQ35296.1 hypothetical protein PAERUG_P2_London_28_IMP_1_06_05_05122 [Pseudomonas aeruginosa]